MNRGLHNFLVQSLDNIRESLFMSTMADDLRWESSNCAWSELQRVVWKDSTYSVFVVR